MELNEKIVETYLLNKGIQPQNLGFEYLKEAILVVVKNPEYKYNVCTKLYPTIAGLKHTTPSRVERAMRHALFRAKINITNSHFIALAHIDLKNKDLKME